MGSTSGIIPSEMSSPKRSDASCWIGRLASRYEPANIVRIARRRGPNGPVGTPAGSSARGGPAAGARQLVEAVFIDVGPDGRDLCDLVSQGVGIVSPQCGATALALRRLNLNTVEIGASHSLLLPWVCRPTRHQGGYDSHATRTMHAAGRRRGPGS